MHTTTPGKVLREGSALKRTAILAAARQAFLADGVDRTSMDAIAAGAEVSKRTVYDYYGDKQTLLIAVIDQAVKALGASISSAIDEHLRDVDDLETALVSFAARITTTAIGSSDYNALMRLVAAEAHNLPDLRLEHWSAIEPEDAVAERFAEFDSLGMLAAPRPRLAADHFVALTLSASVYSLGGPAAPAHVDTHRMIVDGVQAFLRAYGPAK